MSLLSIITPTYNRAYTLSQCYSSLCRQSCKDFEWIIVDDGSTDNTQEVISGFCDNIFQISIVCKENGGKHTALNAAHQYIHGDYVMILDSDDYLTDTAVDEVLSAWRQFSKEETIGILTFLKGTSRDNPVCIATDYNTPVDILRYRRKSITGSDCCETIHTELFLKYPFPVFKGERFISECALWNRVGQDKKCVYIDSVIYICNYLADGLTKAGRSMRIQNPMGGMYTSNLRMSRRNFLIQRWKYGILYVCYGCFAKIAFKQQVKESGFPLLTTACYPLGRILHLIWKQKYTECR